MTAGIADFKFSSFIISCGQADISVIFFRKFAGAYVQGNGIVFSKLADIVSGILFQGRLLCEQSGFQVIFC